MEIEKSIEALITRAASENIEARDALDCAQAAHYAAQAYLVILNVRVNLPDRPSGGNANSEPPETGDDPAPTSLFKPGDTVRLVAKYTNRPDGWVTTVQHVFGPQTFLDGNGITFMAEDFELVPPFGGIASLVEPVADANAVPIRAVSYDGAARIQSKDVVRRKIIAVEGSPIGHELTVVKVGGEYTFHGSDGKTYYSPYWTVVRRPLQR